MEKVMQVNGIPCGITMLKVVIRESHVDTNAMVQFIHEYLSLLDTYMQSIDSKITKFNQHVQNPMNSLKAHGADTQDLLPNLFKGYAAASDKVFTAYIQKKQGTYDDGAIIEPGHLMRLVQNNYKSMVEGKKWRKPDSQEERSLPLKQRSKSLLHLTRGRLKIGRMWCKATKMDPRELRLIQVRSQNLPGCLRSQLKGEMHKKTVNGKQYHWCPKHESWTCHLPQNCRKLLTNKPRTAKSKGKEAGSKFYPSPKKSGR